MATTGFIKNFVVKNGITTGPITLDASSGNITGTNLSVTGNSNLGAIANVHITGGTTGQAVITDGAGNLTFGNVTVDADPAPMPTYIAVGNTVTISANYQGIFGYPITVDGTIVVDGILVDVNDATVPAGNINYVQYNAGNTMGGDANFYYTAVNGTMTVQNETIIGNSTIGNLVISRTANLGSSSNVKITGGINGYYLQTDGAGNLSWAAGGGGGSGSPGGANTQVQFNDAGLFGGNSAFTFNKTTGALIVTGNVTGGNLVTGGVVSATGNVTGSFILGNGSQLTGITATTATTAGTVTTAAQPNITSVGTLTSVSVSGNANIGNIGTAGLITATGNLNAGNIITGGILSVTGNANIGNGTSGTINLGDGSFSKTAGSPWSFVGGVQSGYLWANGSGIQTTQGTVTSPSLQLLGTGGLGLYFPTTSSLAVAVASTQVANFSSTGVNVTGVVSATGNVTGAYILGNGSQLTGITSSTATTAGTVTTNAQPNITSTGTLTSLGVSGAVTSSTLVSNVATGTAPLTVTSTTQVANLNVATAGVAGTVTTAAQPNITSTGTLTAVTILGNVTAQGNINMTGYVIRSVATGVSAAGSTQGTATAITKEIDVVSTVASGAGVILPTAVAGMAITITNTSANSLLVYPATGAQINSLGTNVGYTQASGSTLQFVAPTTTQWYIVGASYA